jgi:purine-nucleoside phosphorylase
VSGGIDVGRAAAFVESRLPFVPRLAVVLGSGLDHLVDEVEDPATVSFTEVPGFPPVTVPGHAGTFVAGRLDGAEVLFQRGRYHVYEGHALDVVCAPVRIAATLGVESLVLTNAAGGVRPSLGPGDLVLLHDHLNLMARSPLVGRPEEGETRFPDMSEPYDAALQRIALAAAEELGIDLERGVYAAVLGPAYETAAEVRMLGRLGADVVGMSTVPEVLVARARGLRVLALSVVTNQATGLGAGPLSHEEVVAVGRKAGGELARLLRAVIPRIGAESQSGSTK